MLLRGRQTVHPNPIINQKVGCETLHFKPLQCPSETNNWMAVVQSVCLYPINCITDSPSKAPALRSTRSADETSSPYLLIGNFVLYVLVCMPVGNRAQPSKRGSTNFKFYVVTIHKLPMCTDVTEK